MQIELFKIYELNESGKSFLLADKIFILQHDVFTSEYRIHINKQDGIYSLIMKESFLQKLIEWK
jgi:hypothetical protein